MFLGTLLFLTIMTSAQVWSWSPRLGWTPREVDGLSLAPGGGPWHRLSWPGGPWHREKSGKDNSILMMNYAISEGSMLQALLRTIKSLSELRRPTMATTDSNIGTVIP